MSKRGTHWWESPCTFNEKVDFLKYRTLSPKEPSEVEAPEGVQPLVSDYTFRLEVSEKGKKISMIFTGDLMPFGNAKPSHTIALEQFLASADYVIFDLEGVVTGRRRFLALSHSHTPLCDYLHISSRRGVVLSMANNHASGFGCKTFSLQNQRLRDRGFLVIRDTPTPLTIEDRITLSARTFLSDQPPVIEALSLTHPSISREWRLLQHTYDVFIPHWGHGMHLSPTQEQIALYRSIVLAIYDSVVGSRTHTPQPVYLSESFVLATSLGNYYYLNHNPNHWVGSLLKCTFAIQEGPNIEPVLSHVELRHAVQHVTRSRLLLDLVDAIDYHSLRKATDFYRWNYLEDLLK